MKQTRNRGGPARGAGRRKKEQRKRAAQALAAGAAIAGGTQAYASPVRFDNPSGPGHFVWPSISANSFAAQWLDLTFDASSQPAVGDPNGPTRIRQIPSSYGYVGTPGGVLQTQVGGLLGYPIDLLGVSPGTAIPTPGASWTGLSYAAYLSYAGYESLITDGVAAYLGVRFNGPSYQYGWIGVVRTGEELDAFAWGYETEVGVPIPAGAPEPGTLASLAVGALAVLGRRRRRPAE